MKKDVHEQILPTVLLALAGFMALVVSVPEWATLGVLAFGVVLGVVACAVDRDIRDALLRSLDSCLRRNDSSKSKPAKAPASSRAAT